MQCSGRFWRLQNLTILRFPVGDVNVYKLPHLGMQLKADTVLHGALERPLFLKVSLLPYYGEWVMSFLACQVFWKATCHPSFPTPRPRQLCHSMCSKNQGLILRLALAGYEEPHLPKHKQAKGHKRQLLWAKQQLRAC